MPAHDAFDAGAGTLCEGLRERHQLIMMRAGGDGAASVRVGKDRLVDAGHYDPIPLKTVAIDDIENIRHLFQRCNRHHRLKKGTDHGWT